MYIITEHQKIATRNIKNAFMLDYISWLFENNDDVKEILWKGEYNDI